MKADSIKIQYPKATETEDIEKIEIVLTVNKNLETMKKITKLKEIAEKGKLLSVDIKQYRPKRSLDANAYCWVLSQKIAEKIGNSKEFVYKQAIKQVGQFEIIPIKNEALEKWIQIWEGRGLGWQSEVMRESKIDGYTTTINYYGSSVYDSKQMHSLLEEIIYQAEELGIDTMTEREKEELVEKWRKKYG